jgi:hypothetical protein
VRTELLTTPVKKTEHPDLCLVTGIRVMSRISRLEFTVLQR